MAACGHVNKQYFLNGVQTDLKCTKPVDHTGDHSAPYILNGEEAVTDWTDLAGEKKVKAAKTAPVKGAKNEELDDQGDETASGGSEG